MAVKLDTAKKWLIRLIKCNERGIFMTRRASNNITQVKGMKTLMSTDFDYEYIRTICEEDLEIGTDYESETGYTHVRYLEVSDELAEEMAIQVTIQVNKEIAVDQVRLLSDGTVVYYGVGEDYEESFKECLNEDIRGLINFYADQIRSEEVDSLYMYRVD